MLSELSYIFILFYIHEVLFSETIVSFICTLCVLKQIGFVIPWLMESERKVPG